MPELPEVEAIRRRFGPRLEGQSVTQVSVNPRKGYMLRYPADSLIVELAGRHIGRVWRRGKHLLFDLRSGDDEGHLVINPMLGGRFHLGPTGGRAPANWVFGLAIGNGDAVHYLDSRDMGRVYWAHDLDLDVPGWSELGPEADSVARIELDAFRRRLRHYRGEMKDVLRNQSFLAGIGNAYSDEILFEAGILPLRRRASLTMAEEEALYRAIPLVLDRAIEAILSNPHYEESKQDRSFMSVHGKGGGTCPRCGHRISQIGSSREPLNFCRGCQH